MRLWGVMALMGLFLSNAYGALKWYVPAESNALKFFGATLPKMVNKTSVSILIWNTHKEVYDSAWQEEFSRLSRGMDFILLQESITKINFWLTKFKYPQVYNGYAGVAGFSFYYLGKFNGNVNLAHFSPTQAKIIHTDDREPVVNTVKPILVTRYQLPSGQLLTLANIHAINFVGSDIFRRQIEKGLRYLTTLTGPIVFAGDFNSWSEEKLSILKQLMQEAGFSQVVLRHAKRGKKVFGLPIDHIFVRDVEVEDADYLEHQYSDHTPMLLRINL